MSDASAGYDVFLSYSRADSAAAETLRVRLGEAGLHAFLDRYALPAGQPWQPWLEQHLGSCRALVVLVGPKGLGEWQHREIQLGLDRQASAVKTARPFPVIPVLLPGLPNDGIPVGQFLSLNTWVDLRSGLDEVEGVQRLISGAQGNAIDTAAAEKLLAGLTPYRGLLPFREQDAGLFFGRERFVKELVQKVGQRTATNVIAVIGRSGSGKSSIVFAGLLPALRRERGLSRQSVWQIVDLRPYAEPLQELALTFNPPNPELGPVDRRAELNRLANRLRNREVSLAELVCDRLRDDPGATRLLLYVDQWEELYTQATPREIKSDEDRSRAADAKLFIDLVLEAAAKSSCTLVLSVRSDFYPDIQTHERLRAAVQDGQVSLGTMDEPELRAAIEGPPKALGASVDTKLTERLIRDIGLDPASGRSDEYDIGKLPLLEYALEQAWAKRTAPEIGLAQYAGLELALEERANTLYGRLSVAEQAAAKRLFVSLVTPGEGREDTRARIAMPDDASMRSVIQTFAGTEARLIVTDEAGGRRSVEVSHEALIRHWEKLRAWVDENRENLRTRDFLRASQAEWLEHGRDPSLLIGPNLHLEAARRLYEQPGDVMIGEIRDYIEASLEEKQRQQEAVQRKDRQASWLRNAVIAVLAALLVVAALGFWRASSEAERADKEATLTRNEAARADREAASAQRSAENAFKAENKMLDVVSADRLEGTITVKAAADLLKSAQAIFTAVEDRPELRLTRMDLLLKISDTNILVAGDQDAALGNLQTADQILQSFPASDQSDKDWLSRAYQTAYKIGDIKASQNKLDEAIVEYKHSVVVGKQLADRQPDNIERQSNLRFILNKIGDIYKIRKRWAPALNTYNDSYTIGERLLKAHPADPIALTMTADATARIADALSDMTLLADAREEYNRTIEIQEALVQSYPDNNTYLSNLSSSHRGLGSAYLGSGLIADALDEYRKAQQGEEKLSRNDESNTEWKVALARDHMSIGDACATTDETTKSFDLGCAEDNYRQAAGIRDALAEKAPARADWQTAAARSHRALGSVLAGEQKFEAAAAEFKAEVDHDGPLAKSQPLNAGYQAALADAFDHFGDALAQAGKNGEALDAYQNGLAGVERYLKAKPDEALKGRQDAFAKKIEELGQSR